MKKRKYIDRTKVESSSLIPFIKEESKKDRHERRKNININNKHIVESWCNNRAISFLIKNEGHHWILKRGGQVVEWWPSSAKMVVNKSYKEGVHVYDYQQFMREAEWYFPILEIEHDMSLQCEYCDDIITEDYVIYGDVLLHPYCHVNLCQEYLTV